MTEPTVSLEIPCPCGKTKIKNTADPLGYGVCHCNECRRLTQGTALPAIVLPPGDSTFQVVEGNLVAWKRPDMRMTVYACDDCKCMLYHTEKSNLVCLSMTEYERVHGSLSDPIKPTFHCWYRERSVDVADDLPKFSDLPASFGGSDKRLNNDGSPVDAEEEASSS